MPLSHCVQNLVVWFLSCFRESELAAASLVPWELCKSFPPFQLKVAPSTLLILFCSVQRNRRENFAKISWWLSSKVCALLCSEWVDSIFCNFINWTESHLAEVIPQSWVLLVWNIDSNKGNVPMELWEVIIPKLEGFKLNLKSLSRIRVMPSLPGDKEETKHLYLHNSSAKR